MEPTHSEVDPLENYSYVGGSSRAGEFQEDSLSISAFQPQAVSTSTKSGRDLISETYGAEGNRFQLSFSSLVTTDDDQANKDDTSSLGLLRSEHFRSPDNSVTQLFEEKKENDVSVGWNVSTVQQDGFPDFSAEFNGRDIQNNLEFIEKEEARNKAEHPFIQEEVIDANNFCDTSSWSVSRGLDAGDGRPPGTLQTSSQSNVSVSSFFKRRSGALGHWENSSVVEHEPSPSFGTTMVERKSSRTSPPPTSQAMLDHQHTLNRTPAPPTASYFGSSHSGTVVKKPLSDQPIRSQSSLQRAYPSDLDFASQPPMARFIAKPPKAPTKPQTPSSAPNSIIVQNDVSSIFEKSTVSKADSSSFCNLSALQAIIANLPDGNGSFLAKQIIAETGAVAKPRKKDLLRNDKPGRVNESVKAKKAEPSASSREAHNAVAVIANPDSKQLAEKNGRTLDEAADNRNRSPVPAEATNHHRQPPDSIPVEMVIHGVLYKGTLHAQPVQSSIADSHSNW